MNRFEKIGREELLKRMAQIRTRAEFADFLEISPTQLFGHLHKSSKNEYVRFEIPKRSGESRVILAPTKELKFVQRTLNEALQLIYISKPCAFGFVYGRNIVDNATRHVRKRFVFNLDIEDFFPSINFGRVRGLFMAKPYEFTPSLATLIAQLCCTNNQLPQGAPTSPVISNMICARLDSEMMKIAKEHKCIYTRYADDITISTSLRHFPPEVAAVKSDVAGEKVQVGYAIQKAIEDNGFEINEEKVRLQSRIQRQQVTGLTVNEFPNVSQKYIRQVRAMLHAWSVYGYELAEKEYREKYQKKHRNNNRPRVSFRKVLKGKIDFLGMVRGTNDKIYIKYWNQLVYFEPRYGEPRYPQDFTFPLNKPLLFVEGITDRDILNFAIAVLAPDLVSKIFIYSDSNAGASWVTDKIIAWVRDRNPTPVIALFDKDQSGDNAKKEADDYFLRIKRKHAAKTLRYEAPKHLHGIFDKKLSVDVTLEEMFPPQIWLYAKSQNWLVTRKDALTQNKFDEHDQTFSDYCKEKGLSDVEQLYVQYKIGDDKTKRLLVNYIRGLHPVEKRAVLEPFGKIVEQIRKHLDRHSGDVN